MFLPYLANTAWEIIFVLNVLAWLDTTLVQINKSCFMHSDQVGSILRSKVEQVMPKLTW